MKKILALLFIVGIAGIYLFGIYAYSDEMKVEVNLGSTLRDSKIDRIKDNIEIGKINKSIAFTDDNTGENFIIKSDNHNYGTLGGDIMAYFSITNVSEKNQVAEVLFSTPGEEFVRSVERFEGNSTTTEEKDIEIVTQVSSSSPVITMVEHKVIENKVDNWTNISFSDFDISKIYFERKPTPEAKINKTFKDNFNIGETKYYRAVIRIPIKDDGKEWFIEVIGKNYGHLDPNNWVYEQKFNDLNTAQLIGQDSWAHLTGTDSLITVNETSPYEGTKHVKMTTNGWRTKRAITGIVSGTIYISMNNNGTANQGTYFDDGGDDWSGPRVYLYSNANGNLILADGVTDENVGTYTPGTYVRVGIAFETGDGGWEGLSADTFKINVANGAWSSAVSTGAAYSQISSIILDNSSSAEYWDYISYEYTPAPILPSRPISPINFF